MLRTCCWSLLLLLDQSETQAGPTGTGSNAIKPWIQVAERGCKSGAVMLASLGQPAET
jgi:hypothetical protein